MTNNIMTNNIMTNKIADNIVFNYITLTTPLYKLIDNVMEIDPTVTKTMINRRLNRLRSEVTQVYGYLTQDEVKLTLHYLLGVSAKGLPKAEWLSRLSKRDHLYGLYSDSYKRSLQFNKLLKELELLRDRVIFNYNNWKSTGLGQSEYESSKYDLLTGIPKLVRCIHESEPNSPDLDVLVREVSSYLGISKMEYLKDPSN